MLLRRSSGTKCRIETKQSSSTAAWSRYVPKLRDYSIDGCHPLRSRLDAALRETITTMRRPPIALPLGVGVLVCGVTTLAAQEAEPLRALILTGQHNHRWQETTPLLKRIYEESGRFAVDVTETPAACDASTFAKYDVLVSNWSGFPKVNDRQWGDKTEKAFLDFVHSGKGFALFHAASASFHTWPEFQQLIAATWGKGTGHGPRHTFKVTIGDQDHPITRGLRDFWIHDELWHRMATQPTMEVLCTAFSAKDRRGTGRDEPVAIWTRFGKGRCFNLVLGHDVKAMRNVAWRTLMLRGTEWAATDEVTIPAPNDWPTTAALAEVSGTDIDAILEVVAQYELGQGRSPLLDLARVAQAVSPDAVAREKLAGRMAALLNGKATVEGKRFLCEQLGVLASARHVPAVAQLLNHAELTVVARGALEKIGGEKATAAVRAALHSAEGRARVGVIQTLGRLRDVESIPALTALIDRGSQDLQAAAVAALGDIGGKRAADALLSARPKIDAKLAARWADSLLACAEGLLANEELAARLFDQLLKPGGPAHVRRAAFSGHVAGREENREEVVLSALTGEDPVLQSAALHVLRQGQHVAVTDVLAQLTDTLARLPSGVQVQLVALVRSTKDSRGVLLLSRAAKSKDEALRSQALAALGTVGDARAVPVLIGHLQAASRGDRDRIVGSLARLRGQDVDPRLIAALRSAESPAADPLIEALIRRNTTDAAPVLVELTKCDQAGLVRQAVKALGELGDASVVPHLVSMLTGARSRSTKATAQTAIAKICQRRPEKRAEPVLACLAAADATTKLGLLHVLAAVGGADAEEAVARELAAKDHELRLAAIRSLAGWKDDAPLDRLLEIAREGADPLDRALALRGVLRMLGEARSRATEERIDLLCVAAPLATQPAERQALLSCAAKLPSPKTLQLAQEQLAHAEVEDAAFLSVVTIAEALQAYHPGRVKEALRQAVAAASDDASKARAQALLNWVMRGGNLAKGAKVESDDGLSPDGQGQGPHAAIDGNPGTYWDEKNGQKLYHIRVKLPKPASVAALLIVGYQHHNYAPKDFEILCDGQLVKRVTNAVYQDNRLIVPLPETRCSSVELRITKYYGHSPAIRELEIYGPSSAPPEPEPPKPTGPPKLTWQRAKTSVALLNHGRPVWRFNYGPDRSKPFFNPVGLLDGTSLTWDGPPDHPWHHALWFSWKYINKLNYWEESRKTGRSAGLTAWGDARVETRPDFSARIEMDLRYHPPDKEPALTERRVVHVSPPDSEGQYSFDWAMSFKACDGGAVLDRNPSPGRGYAGLSVRFARDLTDWEAVGSEGEQGTKTHGKKGLGMDLNGVVQGQTAGLAIFDHPQNLNSPSPWFVIMNWLTRKSAAGPQRIPFAYFSPAVLYGKPHKMAAGDTLTLRYRVVVHPGRWDAAKLKRACAEFAQTKSR